MMDLKIMKTIREGNFVEKTQDWYSRHRVILFTHDRYVNEIYSQVKAYKLLEKEYSYIIEKGVDKYPRKKSDKVWVCWFQGLENAPDLVKACINSLKLNMRGKEVIVLSDDNINYYCTFPTYIIDKKKSGAICPAQFSDLLRVRLLNEYGGIWIDSTALCTASSGEWDTIMNAPLFLYKNINLTPNAEQPTVCSSWFISSYSHSQILMMTEKLLLEYWKDWDYALNYFIFHLFFKMSTLRYFEEWEGVPTYDNASPHIMGKELKAIYTEERWKQYLQMSSIHKLNRYEDFSQIKDSNYSHILEKYL